MQCALTLWHSIWNEMSVLSKRVFSFLFPPSTDLTPLDGNCFYYEQTNFPILLLSTHFQGNGFWLKYWWGFWAFCFKQATISLLLALFIFSTMFWCAHSAPVTHHHSIHQNPHSRRQLHWICTEIARHWAKVYHRSFPSRKALLQNKSALLLYEWGHHKYKRIAVDRYSAKKKTIKQLFMWLQGY